MNSRRGVRSDPVSLEVTDTSPALFTQNSSGLGSGAILNQNYSVNDGTNPAPPDSVVILFATGEGQTTPAGTDGQITGELLPQPLKNVRVAILEQTLTFGFKPSWNAEVLYAGAAPGLVAGVLQVNIRIPGNLPSGRHEVVLTIGVPAPPEICAWRTTVSDGRSGVGVGPKTGRLAPGPVA